MNALALDPDLKVDPKSDVPPSVQKALDEVRAAKHVKIVNVIVNGLPPVVELTCDGRNVGPRFKVTAGPHVLVAVAPGRRAVTRSFDVAADTSLTITLPVELRSDVTKTIADAIAKPERSNLAALAKELEVDWLVIVAPAGEATRALLVRGDIGVVAGFEDAAGADAGATLGDWAANELKEQLSGGKPRVVRPVGQGTDVRAQLALATRIRKLSGGGGDYSAFFAGAGARVLAENARGARVFAGELEILDYSLTTLEVSLPDGSKRSAGGGRTLALAGGAAWQRPLGDGTFAVRGGGGLAAELHLATDVTYPSGQKSGLLTGYTRIAPELTGGARMRTGGARTIAISADLGVSPISLWIESTGANGSSPKPGLALTWRLGGGVERPTSPWAWHVEYRGSQRSVSFSGRADAPSSPPIDDATLAESFHSLGFTASRRF